MVPRAGVEPAHPCERGILAAYTRNKRTRSPLICRLRFTKALTEQLGDVEQRIDIPDM